MFEPSTALLIGTDAGVSQLTGDGSGTDASFGSRAAIALHPFASELWAIADRRTVVVRDPSGTWTDVASSDGPMLTCLVRTPGGLFAGTDEAHLLRLDGDRLARVEPFEATQGRDAWFTPWGGPPAVRSIAMDLAGRIHANVHVGGIPRSTDGGGTWQPTIDIDADVHQVLAHPSDPDVVLAAGAVGLAVSRDGGATWAIQRDGLRSTYARAVAVAGDHVLLSASNGPRGGQAAVYRARLGPQPRLVKCTDGLPEWFEGNIDSGWLVARGPVAAFGTGDGTIFRSDDEGERWSVVAEGLPSIRVLCLV
ncbi:MAG: hypothetical protein WB297_09010 [Actinomycetota bacterium]